MTNAGFIGHGPESSAMLYLDGVTVSFDGFRALDNLSLVLEPGELRAVIGPNGAGKSTMMDVITGRVRPDTGDVLFKDGIDLTRHDEAYIANLGIGRKFQTPTVFENQSVYHNLEIAMQAPRGVWPNLWHRPGPRDGERIDQTLETIGLAAQRHTIAGTLAHGLGPMPDEAGISHGSLPWPSGRAACRPRWDADEAARAATGASRRSTRAAGRWW